MVKEMEAMATETRTRIKRTDIERNARAFLEKARGLHPNNGIGLKYHIKQSDFEELVSREVETTIAQLQKLGKTVGD